MIDRWTDNQRADRMTRWAAGCRPSIPFSLPAQARRPTHAVSLLRRWGWEPEAGVWPLELIGSGAHTSRSEPAPPTPPSLHGDLRGAGALAAATQMEGAEEAWVTEEPGWGEGTRIALDISEHEKEAGLPMTQQVTSPVLPD